MFKAANPYDEVVIKSTDENLTSESWELNLDVCDKVSGEGESGARNCILAIQKRLVHRSANVQLYSLTLSDMLAKNCGIDAHRELASRAFTSTLTRVVSDRNTHEKVKKRTLELIKTWGEEWEGEPSLGLMKETGETLKRQGFSFDEEMPPAPVEPSTDALRAEDEELRKVLELSMHDQGGRNGWNPGSSYASQGQGSSSSAAVASGSGSGSGSAAGTSQATPTSSGYIPGPSAPSTSTSADKALPDPSRQSSLPTQQTTSTSTPVQAPVSQSSAPQVTLVASASTTTSATSATSAPAPPVAASRVRALYDFAPTEAGELPFQKGDIIRVLDSVYEHWWRGELKGEAGIFPVNYVEILPDRTPDDIQREAELEARIFAQANNIDKLLMKLRGLDATTDNLAEDDELQELYQTSLSMRPKIVRLIDRYSTKITELKSMNDKFVRARGIFDTAMEESLSRHNPGAHSHEYTQSRPEYQVVQQQAQQDYSAQWAAYYANLHAQGQNPQQQAPAQSQQPQQTQEQADAYAKWYYSQQNQQQVAAQQNQHQASKPQHQPQQAQQQQPHPQAQQTQQQPAHAQQASGPDYSQYYAQQQAQAAAGQGAPLVQVQSPTPQETQPPGPLPSPLTGPSSQAQGSGSGSGPSPGISGDPNAPHDSEKRRLYEKARAEAEAYHSQHAQQQAGGSGQGIQLQQSMSGMSLGGGTPR